MPLNIVGPKRMCKKHIKHAQTSWSFAQILYIVIKNLISCIISLHCTTQNVNWTYTSHFHVVSFILHRQQMSEICFTIRCKCCMLSLVCFFCDWQLIKHWNQLICLLLIYRHKQISIILSQLCYDCLTLPWSALPFIQTSSLQDTQAFLINGSELIQR